MEPLKWLLLIHHIPPKPDYFRVKVRRRLARLGAVALKNSVYLLPWSEEATEDFVWLSQGIQKEGGDATVAEAAIVHGTTDAELQARFLAQSRDEFLALRDEIRASTSNHETQDMDRFKRKLVELDSRDFFGSEAREETVAAMKEFEETVGNRRVESESPGGAPRVDVWVTRKGVFIDRIASAWLIRRFIDEHATFKFVDARGYEPIHGEVRFDMFDGEYTHEGDDCTFEVLLTRFELGDTALAKIAEIVHDIDLKDDKYGRPEAPGVAATIRGICDAKTSDEARIESAAPVFDGLYSAFTTGR